MIKGISKTKKGMNAVYRIGFSDQEGHYGYKGIIDFINFESGF